MSSATKNNNDDGSDNIESNFLQEVEVLRLKYEKKRKELMDEFISNNITAQEFTKSMDNLVNGENEDYKRVSNVVQFSFFCVDIVLCFIYCFVI